MRVVGGARIGGTPSIGIMTTGATFGANARRQAGPYEFIR